MPAESKAQQHFMGMVHAVQKGEMKSPSSAVASAAKSISPQAATEFASTKTKGLPKHKKAAELLKAAEALLPAVMADQIRAQQQMQALQQSKQPQSGAAAQPQAPQPTGGFGMGGPQGAASALGPPAMTGKLGNGPGANMHVGNQSGGYKVAHTPACRAAARRRRMKKKAMGECCESPKPTGMTQMAKRHKSLRTAADGLFKKHAAGTATLGTVPGTHTMPQPMLSAKPLQPAKPAMAPAAPPMAGPMRPAQPPAFGGNPMAQAHMSGRPPAGPPGGIPDEPQSDAFSQLQQSQGWGSNQSAASADYGPMRQAKMDPGRTMAVDEGFAGDLPGELFDQSWMPQSHQAYGGSPESAFFEQQGAPPTPPTPGPPEPSAVQRSVGETPNSLYAGTSPEEAAFFESQGNMPAAPPPTPGGASIQNAQTAPKPVGRFSHIISDTERMLQGTRQRLQQAQAAGDTRKASQIQRHIASAEQRIADLAQRQGFGQEEYKSHWAGQKPTDRPADQAAAAEKLFTPGGQLDWYQQAANNAAAGKPQYVGISPHSPQLSQTAAAPLKVAADLLFTRKLEAARRRRAKRAKPLEPAEKTTRESPMLAPATPPSHW